MATRRCILLIYLHKLEHGPRDGVSLRREKMSEEAPDIAQTVRLVPTHSRVVIPEGCLE